MTTQPTSIDEVVEELRQKFTEKPHAKNSIVQAVASWEIEEFIVEKLTTLVEQARQEGRDMAVEYIKDQWDPIQPDSVNIAVEWPKLLDEARTISSDSKNV